MDVIKDALARGVRNYIGGNCTVSLMLMGMHGLFKADLVEWMTSMTYQAASGAGAEHMRELVQQMGFVYESARSSLEDPACAILEVDARGDLRPARRGLSRASNSGSRWRAACSPGSTRTLARAKAARNGKSQAEGNKILGREANPIPMDGICVRIGAMRCHSQALTVKLKRDLPLDEIEHLLAEANDWVRVVPNEREATLRDLTPAKVSGTLRGPDWTAAQARPRERRHLPHCIHRRGPAALGRRRAVAPNAASTPGQVVSFGQASRA